MRPKMIANIAVAFAFTWQSAAAQDRSGGFITGALAAPYQQGITGESHQTYRAAPGGVTRGWSVGGGIFISSHVAVNVELLRTGAMTSRQHSRYSAMWDDTRRDTFVSTGLRFRFAKRSLTLEPVAAIAVISSYAAVGQQQLRFERRPGLCAGGDLVVGDERLSLLISLRGIWDTLELNHDQQGWYPAGYPKFTFAPAVGVRIGL
jgi:hypothetical protein